MAPELLLHGHMSKAADVYAFGITLWELFTGGNAYKGECAALISHKYPSPSSPSFSLESLLLFAPAPLGTCSSPLIVPPPARVPHCFLGRLLATPLHPLLLSTHHFHRPPPPHPFISPPQVSPRCCWAIRSSTRRSGQASCSSRPPPSPPWSTLAGHTSPLIGEGREGGRREGGGERREEEKGARYLPLSDTHTACDICVSLFLTLSLKLSRSSLLPLSRHHPSPPLLFPPRPTFPEILTKLQALRKAEQGPTSPIGKYSLEADIRSEFKPQDGGPNAVAPIATLAAAGSIPMGLGNMRPVCA
jgi:hypothetical protein